MSRRYKTQEVEVNFNGIAGFMTKVLPNQRTPYSAHNESYYLIDKRQPEIIREELIRAMDEERHFLVEQMSKELEDTPPTQELVRFTLMKWISFIAGRENCGTIPK